MSAQPWRGPGQWEAAQLLLISRYVHAAQTRDGTEAIAFAQVPETVAPLIRSHQAPSIGDTRPARCVPPIPQKPPTAPPVPVHCPRSSLHKDYRYLLFPVLLLAIHSLYRKEQNRTAPLPDQSAIPTTMVNLPRRLWRMELG